MKKCWIDGKTILITGASSGIGRELTKKFILTNNARVIGVGRREEKFKSLIAELGDKSELFEYKLFDVSIEQNWKDLQQELKDKNLDVIINNAGILPRFESFDNFCKRNNETNISQEINKVMDTNFLAVALSCAYLTPIIEKSQTPAIINIASSASLCALPGISIYSASKSAVKNFTESLSLEKDYYVGLMCPGFTKTEIFRNQTRKTDSKLINLIESDLTKMVNKIYRAICKKKKRCVFGFDAKCMDRLYRLAPKSSIKLFRNILKKSHIDLFEDVFN